MSSEAENPSDLPPPRPRRRLRVFLAAAILIILAGVPIHFVLAHRRANAWKATWSTLSKSLPPSGGKPFEKRVVLPVPSFLQSDPRWGADPLGPSSTDTLSSAGCAVSSAAMILASYGVDTDPQRLNDYLQAHNGYTPEAWIKWEVAAQLSPKKLTLYESDASHRLIDENLEKGNPVIVRVRYPSGITHFVVVCGKEDQDYLITDPGKGGSSGVYPLKNLASSIEALRFYSPAGS